MAHAFDNRNFIQGKQQTFYSVDSPRRDMKNDRREISSSSQLSPSYEETTSNKSLVNHQKQQSGGADDYFRSISGNHSAETKPPPPARVPRITSTTNNNYIRRPTVLSQYSTNTTYLNTTQLYISQPSSEDHPPPPPPPRYPIHPPAIPPRNPLISHQKNSIIIPDFNSFVSSEAIYGSPIVEGHHLNDRTFPKSQLNPLTIDTNPHIRETTNGATVGEYFGDCRKCGETITSLDDPCDLLGQLYHGSCAVCVLCGQSVKNKHFYIKDQLYCEDDFLNMGIEQTFERCVACNHLINDTILQALGETYHVTCFKCSKCSVGLDGRPFIRDKSRNLFCLPDYHMTYGPRCHACANSILPEEGSHETVRIISMGKSFHIECYQCEDCSMQLGDEQGCRCYPLDDALLCQECCHRRLVFVNKF